jgi:hypothetical protein
MSVTPSVGSPFRTRKGVRGYACLADYLVATIC